MEDNTDVIIVSGGRGSRMEEAARKYGCKSLVPILGIPAISYLTHAIIEVIPNSRIILAIDNPQLRPKFEAVYSSQGVANYHIYEGLPRGPVQAFYEAGSMCRSDKVLIFFGNQLVSPSHLERLLSHDNQTLVFSGFGLLSENNCKIATMLWNTLDGNPAYLNLDSIKHFLHGAKSDDYFLDLARTNALSLTNNFL